MLQKDRKPGWYLQLSRNCHIFEPCLHMNAVIKSFFSSSHAASRHSYYQPHVPVYTHHIISVRRLGIGR